MFIEGKKYTYRQLMVETGLSRSTLHRRIKALKESNVPITLGAILKFPTNWAFHDEEGNYYSSKTEYAITKQIPYYQMFQDSNSQNIDREENQ